MIRIEQNVKFSELFYVEYFISNIFILYNLHLQKKKNDKIHLKWSENIKFSEL